MSRPSFDTNILIYSIDRRDMRKHLIARRIVRRCAEQDGVLSLQCLSEFYRAVTKKRLLPDDLAFDVVEETMSSIRIVAPSEADLLLAMQHHHLHKTQFFDALIGITTQRAGASVLYSEDFSHGDTYFGLKVLNPFVMSDTEIDEACT